MGIWVGRSGNDNVANLLAYKCMKSSTRTFIGLAIVFLPVGVVWLSYVMDWDLARGDRIVFGALLGFAIAWMYRLGQKRVNREEWRRRRW